MMVYYQQFITNTCHADNLKTLSAARAFDFLASREATWL